MASETLGARLKEIREAAHWSQARLAKAMGLSSHSTISHWESNQWDRRSGNAIPLANLTGVIEQMYQVSPELCTEEAVFDLIVLAGYNPTSPQLETWWQNFLAKRPHLRKVMSSPWPQVPPAWRLPRPDLAVQLREVLLHLPADARRVVVCGPAGSGKRTLLDNVKDEAALAAAFPDGVLIAELGRRPNVLGWQTLWAEAAGVQLAGYDQNPQARLLRLREILRHHRWLLVIAEIYAVEEAELLLAGGPGCAAILTTPDQAVSVALARYLPADQYVEVGALSQKDAAQLWQKHDQPGTLSPEELAWLHGYVQGNALALSGALTLVRQRGLAYVREALAQITPSPLPSDVEEHVFCMLQVAHRLLSAEARVALERLAAFPRVRLYSLPPLLVLWECSPVYARRWLNELAACNLVTLEYGAEGALIGCALHEQTYRFVRHLALQRGECVTVAERLWPRWLARYFANLAGQAEQAELHRQLKRVGGRQCLWLLGNVLRRLDVPWWKMLLDIARQSRSDMAYLLDMPELTLAEWCLAAQLRRKGIALEHQAPRRVLWIGLAGVVLKLGLGAAGLLALCSEVAPWAATLAAFYRLAGQLGSWLQLLTHVYGPLLERPRAGEKSGR